MKNKKPPREVVFLISVTRRLGARYVGSCRTLLAIGYFKGDDIANFELIEGNARELFGVEKKILLFAIARDESKSAIRERLDCSGHSFASWGFGESPTTLLLALVARLIVA